PTTCTYTLSLHDALPISWITTIFFSMTIFLGLGALHLVGIDQIMAESSAGNTAAPLLAEFLGGDVLMSFISAVAFATILAVVSGDRKSTRLNSSHVSISY